MTVYLIRKGFTDEYSVGCGKRDDARRAVVNLRSSTEERLRIVGFWEVPARRARQVVIELSDKRINDRWFRLRGDDVAELITVMAELRAEAQRCYIAEGVARPTQAQWLDALRARLSEQGRDPDTTKTIIPSPVLVAVGKGLTGDYALSYQGLWALLRPVIGHGALQHVRRYRGTPKGLFWAGEQSSGRYVDFYHGGKIVR